MTPTDGETSPPGATDEATGASGGAGAMAMPATSTLSLPMSQGKPSLRRIKGRIHRSKSLDSLDLLDSNVRLTARRFRCGTILLSKQANTQKYSTSEKISVEPLLKSIKVRCDIPVLTHR